MKTKATTLILAAAALLAAAACTNDDNDVAVDNNAPVAARITAGMADAAAATPAAKAGQPGTRAVGTRWNRDNIGVVVAKSPGSDMTTRYRNARYVTTSVTTTAEFAPADAGNTIYFADSDEPVEFWAYAPYQPSATPGALPGTDGVITIDATRQTSAEEQEALDFIVSTNGATASKSSPIVRFTRVDPTHDYSFVHIMSRLVLKIETPAAYGFDPADVERISGISLNGLCTGGTFDVKTTDPATGSGFFHDTDRATWTDNWDIAGYVNAVTTTGSVTQRIHTLIFPAQQAEDIMGSSRTVVPITITLDGQTYTNSQDITGSSYGGGAHTGNFKPGTSYEYTIRLRKTGLEVTGATITDWTDGGSATGDATQRP